MFDGQSEEERIIFYWEERLYSSYNCYTLKEDCILTVENDEVNIPSARQI